MKLGLDFPVHNNLGYWNGEPAATSSLFFGAGVAGICNVSTLSYARGKGIGAALTVRPLLEAHEMGYHIGILCQIEFFRRALFLPIICQHSHRYIYVRVNRL